MPDAPDAIQQKKYARIRRLKKLLRPMPRRSNLHKYPILKWFAASARKRDYLWRMHPSEMIRAFYIGWIIALIPMYGLQMAAAFVACFFMRANCIVAMLLQWITNPLTIGPILVGQYFFGDWLLRTFFGFKSIDNSFAEVFRREEFWTAIKQMATGENVVQIVVATLFGGFVISIIGATLTTAFYKYSLYKNRLNTPAEKAK